MAVRAPHRPSPRAPRRAVHSALLSVVLVGTTVAGLRAISGDRQPTAAAHTDGIAVAASAATPGAPAAIDIGAGGLISSAASAHQPAQRLSLGEMPSPETVGVALGRATTSLAPGAIVVGGSYDGVVVTGKIEIGRNSPPTAFSNCVIQGSIVTFSPIELRSCTVLGGIYAFDTGGLILDTLVDSGTNQAFRPGTEHSADEYTTPTPWVVRNSYFRIKQGVPPNHTEASQVLGGVGILFENVVFDTGGPFNGTQTADLNFNGKDMRCVDCYFVGYGGYAIYSEGPDNTFIRPRFARNFQWGILYPNSRMKPTIVDARYLDGSPA